MSKPHNCAVACLRRHRELVGHLFVVDHQRVVASRLKRLGQPSKDPIIVVVDHRGFSVHKFGCVRDHTAVHLANALMAQADSQYWYCACERTDGFAGHASIFGSAGARRY